MKINHLVLLFLIASLTQCQKPSMDATNVNKYVRNSEKQKSQVSQIVNQNICPQNCAYCTSSSSCQQCALGFVIQTDGTCVACSYGCAICRGQQYCNQCQTGFTKIAENSYIRCIPCPPNCLNCQFLQVQTGSVAQLTTCTACAPGFYLKSGTSSTIQTCAPCIQGCFNCLNNSTCNQCVTGYGYDLTTNKCYQCQQHCLLCIPNSGCQRCQIGYYLQVGESMTCQSCIKNCQQCSSFSTCQKCSKGYYPYTTTNPQTSIQSSLCLNCPNQCIQCYNEQICLSCEQGFFLSIVQESQYNDETNQTALVVKSATCTACTENCINCNDGIVCTGCSTGYFINSGGLCQICGDACHRCLGAGQCLQCLGSHYLKNGKCQPCNSLCSSCNLTIVNNQPVSVCTNCVSLFYTLMGGECLSCADMSEGCLTCSDSNTCLTCADGYSLHEGSCLENKKLGVVYIVMLCIAGIIAFVAIVLALWACWRQNNGLSSFRENSNNPGVRASYYEIP